MSSSADSRVGTDFSQLGATSSTWASTFDPRTAAARFGWSDEVSGVANIHAATSTATSCSPTPITESKVRSARLRRAPRTARPSTTPAISPITTSARIRNSVTNSLVRGPLMWLTMCGASSTPATAPRTTPTNDSREPSAPERHPEMAATNAIARTARSSHCDDVIVELHRSCPRARRAPLRRRVHERRRCSTAWPSPPHRASPRSPDR